MATVSVRSNQLDDDRADVAVFRQKHSVLVVRKLRGVVIRVDHVDDQLRR